MGDEQNDNTAFTWEVRANNRAYRKQVQEEGIPCRMKRKYKSNAIYTAKYSFFSFLPLNLYEQFHRMSNIYFLLIIILQTVPEISTLPWFTLFAPLVCLLLIRATRDLVDDIGRHRSDRAINNRPCQILRGRSFLWRKWKDLCVGDVVCLSKDSIVPADLLLLASSEPSSLCYVETADIDGETNLKFRQALTATHEELTSARKMAAFRGTVMCEEPNSRMHHFVGTLDWNGRKYPLDIGKLLLRGSKIRNTDTCYGLVIYAGFDTKIMKNCGRIHLKRTKMDLLMNKLVAVIFLSMVVLSLALTLGFSFMVKEFKEKHHYVSAKHTQTVAMESFLIFWGFLILLSVMVPMAMFIMAEFIYLGNSMFINWDLQMYYKPQDLPARARSTSLNDHLGQVQYLFSDKTGTLTQNIMTFKKCCIQGRIYGSDEEDKPPGQENPYSWNKFADGKLQFYNQELSSIVRLRQDRVAEEFWRLLAICHTVMVQEKGDQLLYQAASPDEEALVTAARNFGYVFLSRTQDTITLVELGEERVYQVLALMDFNSVRKRMSVLVRNPEGTICLYTKGADVVILERLKKRSEMEITTEEVLAAFAEETLRTLCLAYKEVAEDAYKRWEPRHQAACVLLQDRMQALHCVYNELEQNLELLGVTAIEDKLQDGVPETIKCLKKGNIKVWVLTGDKHETAVNIGFACQLLTENMVILEEKDVNRILEGYWASNNNTQTPKSSMKFLSQVNMAMVINGDFLDKLLLSLRKEPRALVQNVVVDEPRQEARQLKRDFLQARRISLMWRNLGAPPAPSQSNASNTQESPEVQRERAFVDLASKCQAVICCRVTPKQKALVVALVKKYQKVVTLAIGDGANDINMIKTADIGVGLAGQEGMQAVQNSDYVLAQFCFLQRLLLVHGRWAYVRVSKFLRYFFYKTVASMMVQVWFSFYNGFTAQPLYEGWFLALFNMLYSTLPVLYIGLFEQDVNAEQSLEMPELYVVGQRDELFNTWVFLQAIAHGTATSLVNFFVTLWIIGDAAGPNSPGDYQSFAVIVALSALLSITMEVALAIRYWTLVCLASVLLSLGFYVIMTCLTQSLWLYKISPPTFPFLYADRSVLSRPSNLLVILLNVALNTLLSLAFRILYQVFQKLCPKKEEAPSEEVITVEPVPQLRREAPARRSSYAFSHLEGYADLITQGTILRRPNETTSETVYETANVSPALSDEELASTEGLPWHSRKLSFLTKKRRQQGRRVSSEKTQPPSTMSLSLTTERPSTLYSEVQEVTSMSLPSTLNTLSGSLQEQALSLQDSQVSASKDRAQLFASQSLPLNRALESQAATSEVRSLSWTPFWKRWLYFWQKEPQPIEEGTEPLPKTTLESLTDTLPPAMGQSPVREQAMDVEPWSMERQPSPMEWLPVPFQDEFPPDLVVQPPPPPEEESLPYKQ